LKKLEEEKEEEEEREREREKVNYDKLLFDGEVRTDLIFYNFEDRRKHAKNIVAGGIELTSPSIGGRCLKHLDHNR